MMQNVLLVCFQKNSYITAATLQDYWQNWISISQQVTCFPCTCRTIRRSMVFVGDGGGQIVMWWPWTTLNRVGWFYKLWGWGGYLSPWFRRPCYLVMLKVSRWKPATTILRTRTQCRLCNFQLFQKFFFCKSYSTVGTKGWDILFRLKHLSVFCVSCDFLYSGHLG